MSELIDEVQEDIRRAYLMRLWQSYGHWLIAAIVAIVIATFGYSYWQQRRHDQQIEKAQAYENALASWDDNQQQALVMLQKIVDAGDPHQMMISLFKLAGNDDKRIEVLERIAQNAKVETPLRELALLMLSYEQLDTINVDILNQRLQPIIKSNSIWRSLAYEIIALVLYRDNKIVEAQDIFKEIIQDRSSAEGLRVRAQAMMDYTSQR